ncbi:MAG: TRAP transporter permease, partial [Clostridia bacterium]|nr:TRAP transporter permease [Clostridia bacterium]
MSEHPEREHEFAAAAQEEMDAIMQKYDRESAFRTLTGSRGVILSVILILFSVLQLYSTWRIIPSTHMRPIHLGIVLMLAYLLYPARRKA